MLSQSMCLTLYLYSIQNEGLIDKKYVISTLILTLFVVAVAISSTFLGLDRAWADTVIKTIPVGLGPQWSCI